MWQGILQGLMLADEERARKEQIEEARRIREEDRAIRQSEFDRNFTLAQARLRMEVADRYGDTQSNSSELVDLSARLSGVIKDPEVVNRIISTGNVERVGEIANQVESFYTSYLEQNPDSAEAASQQLTDILSNSYVFSPAQTEGVDLGALSELLGEETLAGIGPLTRTRPGTAVGAPIVYTPRSDVTQRTQARTDILAGYQEIGNDEIRRIADAVSNLTIRLEDGSLEETERQALENDRIALMDRKAEVESALEAASEDGLFSGVFSLYGDPYIEEYLSNAPFALTRRDLGPAFVNVPPVRARDFVDQAQVNRFAELGVLNPGEVKSFSTEEEARRFAGLGLLRPGDTIVVAGEERVVQ